MRARDRPDAAGGAPGPRRLLLAVEGAGAEAEEWLGGLDAAGFDAVRMDGHGGLRAALRRPLDTILAWDDAAGEHALATLAAVRDAGLGVKVIVVAHPRAAASALRCLEQGAYGVIEAGRPERLAPMASRLLEDLHRDTVAALIGRVAHDLNNVLAPIPLALQLVRLHGGEELGHLATLDGAVRGSMSAVRELSEMLLARPGQDIKVRAKHLVAIASARSREGLGGARRVMSEYPPVVAPIRADPTRVLEVLACLGRRVLDVAGVGDELRYRARDLEIAGGPGSAGSTGFADGADGAGRVREVEMVVSVGLAADDETARWERDAGWDDLEGVETVVAAYGGVLEAARPHEGAARAFRLRFPAAPKA